MVAELVDFISDPLDGAGGARGRVVGCGCGTCADEGDVGFEGWGWEAGFSGAVLCEDDPADGGEDEEEEEEEEEKPRAGKCKWLRQRKNRGLMQMLTRAWCATWRICV